MLLRARYEWPAQEEDSFLPGQPLPSLITHDVKKLQAVTCMSLSREFPFSPHY